MDVYVRWIYTEGLCDKLRITMRALEGERRTRLLGWNRVTAPPNGVFYPWGCLANQSELISAFALSL